MPANEFSPVKHDYREFVRLLEASIERFAVAVHGFVLMGNHFHLMAQTRRANLSRWLHWLMVSYTVYFNWRHQRSGYFFQGQGALRPVEVLALCSGALISEGKTTSLSKG